MVRRRTILSITLFAALSRCLPACHEPTIDSVWREPGWAPHAGAATTTVADPTLHRADRAPDLRKPPTPPTPGPLTIQPRQPWESQADVNARSRAALDPSIRRPAREDDPLAIQPFESIDRRMHRLGLHYDQSTHPGIDTRLHTPSYYERLRRLNEPSLVNDRRWERLHLPPEDRTPSATDGRYQHLDRVRP